MTTIIVGEAARSEGSLETISSDPPTIESVASSADDNNKPANQKSTVIPVLKCAKVAPKGGRRDAAKIATSSLTTEFVFDPNSDIYKANACCEVLHYRQAALVTAAIEMVLLAVWLGAAIKFYTDDSKMELHPYTAIFQGVLMAVIGVTIVLLCYGIHSEKPFFLWPHMIVQVTIITVGILLAILAVVAMALGTSAAELVFGTLIGRENLPEIQQALGPIWPFCLAVIFDFGAAIVIWFYILVRGCYDYLMDKQFFKDNPMKNAVVVKAVAADSTAVKSA